MKIGFIVGTLGRGGAEKQLLFMLKALKNRGIDARVLCLTKNEPYETEIESIGIPIEWVGSRKNRILRLFNIVRNLRKDPVDIIQSSHFYTNIYAGLAGRFLHLPSIGAIRSDLKTEIKIHGSLGKWQVTLPTFLIVNSKVAYRRAIDFGIKEKNIELVNNVVETNTSGAENTTESKSAVRFLFVGRLDSNKRPQDFIKLAARLYGAFPEKSLHFKISGDGELRLWLEDIARSYGLPPDKLEFLGLCDDMKAVYGCSDILVSTSVLEGASNVILEAMSHGLSVVATNTGEASNFLANGKGIVVDQGNEDKLFDAAVKLMKSCDLRDEVGKRARIYVKENHSLERLQNQLSKIYETLV